LLLQSSFLPCRIRDAYLLAPQLSQYWRFVREARQRDFALFWTLGWPGCRATKHAIIDIEEAIWEHIAPARRFPLKRHTPGLTCSLLLMMHTNLKQTNTMLASLLAIATCACSKTVSARALNYSRVYPISWCFCVRRGKWDQIGPL
jgi:hypothetical protein